MKIPIPCTNSEALLGGVAREGEGGQGAGTNRENALEDPLATARFREPISFRVGPNEPGVGGGVSSRQQARPPHPMLGRLWRVSLFLAIAGAWPLLAQQTGETRNIFSGVETIVLPNGLKVWYKFVPDDPNVSISAIVPFGRDVDPVGKEQLAHFTEHMLFADQGTQSEEAFEREVKDLGGVSNGQTGPDYTFYYVRIGSAHGLLAIDWLYRVMRPREMQREVVERERDPVAIEVGGTRPRQLAPSIAAALNPPWLRPPDYWEREFGIDSYSRRDHDPYRSLHNITSADLRWFYERYYSPSTMTVSVIGNLERSAVLATLATTFAKLPARSGPSPDPVTRDPGRPRREFLWEPRADVLYLNRTKFFNLSGDEVLHLEFTRQYLAERLNRKLRFGKRKAVYGVKVLKKRRGRSFSLEIEAPIDPREAEYARKVIENEIEMLRGGTLGEREFNEERAAIVRQLIVGTATSKDLEQWIYTNAHHPRFGRDFPDVAARFASLRKSDLEAFARERLVPEREVLTITRIHPFGQGAIVLSVLGLLFLTVRIARRLFTVRVDMKRIRYVARFRIPLPGELLGGLVLIAMAAVSVRALFFCWKTIGSRWIITVDSVVLQYSIFASMLMVTVFVVVLHLFIPPRKLLLFDDRLMIKSLSYFGWLFDHSRIEELSRLRLGELTASRRWWKCIPLAFGIVRPAIYLRIRNGPAFFFHTRDDEECFEMLETMRAPREKYRSNLD